MRRIPTVLVVLVLVSPAARAEPPSAPVARTDVAVSTGWFSSAGPEQSCCGVWSAGLFKGISAGYYWTDHLKTEAGLADPGHTDFYISSSERLANGSFQYLSEQHHVDGTKFSVAQIYQFGHNSTFHPFVTAGIEVDRERDAIDAYVSSSSNTVQNRRTEIALRTRAFAGTGFKAYFSERAFFKGEVRFAGGGRLDQMTWTAGVGVDLGPLHAAHAAEPSHAPPRGQEPIEIWRRYASQIPIGAVVEAMPAGGDRVIGALVAVEANGILLEPVTRVPEPARHIAFERLEALALHDGPRPGARVGATLAGVSAGAGTFVVTLMILMSHFGG
jgi:opacity protein-like surface antigen